MLRTLVEWMSRPEVRDKIIVGLLVALVAWLLNRTMHLGSKIGKWLFRIARRGRDSLQIDLEGYRRNLDHQAFRIQHAWMKEGQTLSDILVPVVIQSDGIAGGIDDWSIFLARFFRQAENESSRTPRFAVIGGPGAGKSVALKIAAREAWDLPISKIRDKLVPVFFTFSDYRRSGFDLLKTVGRSLELHGFYSFAGSSSPGEVQSSEVQSHVRSKLNGGNYLLLIDALDELDRDDRERATESLVAELKSLSAVPVILSCRTAAWHNQFAEVIPAVVEMADFTPAAVRQFLRRWGFPPPKTSHELLDAIESQPHIGELARSPLMLTIVAFLYSQPKYHLPENRAEFYDICSRALLEEWDQHRNPARANRFERHHKEYVLSELAYRHLCGANPDADLDERTTLKTVAEVMSSHSLKESENLKLLNEILENSGLLLRFPPSGLRFPHQTFLEFYASLHLIRQGNQAQVFEHYLADPERWREVLLLYIGLDSDADDASTAITRLKDGDSLEMALSALVDSRATKPTVSDAILIECKERLECELDPKLITLLGYVASNPRTSHADRAGQILKAILRSVADRQPSPQVLEALLLASLRRPSEDTTRFVVEHVNELQLGRILPQMGERAFVLTSKIMGDAELSNAKKLEWIDGLRRASGVKPLFQIVNQPQVDGALRKASAIALVRLSRSLIFRQEMEKYSENENWNDAGTLHAAKRWGWPFSNPTSAESKRFMVHLASRLATQSDGEPTWEDAMSDEADPRIVYLMSALSREAENQSMLVDPMYSESYLFILRSIWKAVRSKDRVESIRKNAEFNLFEFLSPLLLVILYVWSIVSLVFGDSAYGLRWPRGGVIPLTMAFIFGQFFLVTTDDNNVVENFLFGAVFGPSSFSPVLFRVSSLRWLVLAVTALVLLILSFLVTDIISLRIIVFLILAVQIAGNGFGSSTIPAHPFLANAKTREILEQLIKSDVVEIPDPQGSH